MLGNPGSLDAIATDPQVRVVVIAAAVFLLVGLTNLHLLNLGYIVAVFACLLVHQPGALPSS